MRVTHHKFLTSLSLILLGSISPFAAWSCEVEIPQASILERVYEGGCVDGRASGEGRYSVRIKYPNGEEVIATYIGQFWEGKLNGPARREDSNGARFIGSYISNQAEGIGAFRGTRHLDTGAFWANRLFNGVRAIIQPDGSVIQTLYDQNQVRAQCSSNQISHHENNCTLEARASIQSFLASSILPLPNVASNTATRNQNQDVVGSSAASSVARRDRDHFKIFAPNGKTQCDMYNSGPAPSARYFLLELPEGFDSTDSKRLGESYMRQLVQEGKCTEKMYVKLYLVPPALFAKCSLPQNAPRDRNDWYCADSDQTVRTVWHLGGKIDSSSPQEKVARDRERIVKMNAEQQAKQDAQRAQEVATAKAEAERMDAQVESVYRKISPSSVSTAPKGFLLALIRSSGSLLSCDNADCKDLRVSMLRLPVSREDEANEEVRFVSVFDFLLRANGTDDNRWSNRVGCVKAIRRKEGWTVYTFSTGANDTIVICNQGSSDYYKFDRRTLKQM